MRNHMRPPPAPPPTRPLPLPKQRSKNTALPPQISVQPLHLVARLKRLPPFFPFLAYFLAFLAPSLDFQRTLPKPGVIG